MDMKVTFLFIYLWSLIDRNWIFREFFAYYSALSAWLFI